MAGVALATASAGIIVGCVSLGLGQQITSFVEALSMGNIFLMILITAVASLLLGMGLPTTANYIIMASLTAPVIVTLATGLTLHGQEIAIPLIAAHLFCLYFGILADDTPPVGLAATQVPQLQKRTRSPSVFRASSTIFVQPSSRSSSCSTPTFF